MNSDKFVYYDADFLTKFKKLAEVMEEKDKAVLHRYLIDNFSHIFKVFQYYAREDGNGGVTIRKEKDIPVTEIMGQKKTQSFDVRKCGIGLLEQRMKESGIAYDMSAVKEPDGNELVRVTFLTKDADKVTEALSGFADDLLHGKVPKEKPSVEKQVKENMKKAERTRKRRPGKKMTRGVR